MRRERGRKGGRKGGRGEGVNVIKREREREIRNSNLSFVTFKLNDVLHFQRCQR